MGDGAGGRRREGQCVGQAVWEQRKWEKQDSLEDWAREGSPGTAGPAQGSEQRGGRQRKQVRELRQEEVKLEVVQRPRDPPVADSESRAKPRLLGSSVPDSQYASV